ncbi:CPBP family intramembrane metalloprotease [Candidatus Saccharibacteria bacterium]|nr:CPBP family intramembrane metalloprotease [Candidatus Saccharibacteria bacterium]
MNMIRKNSLASFFILVFLLPWLVWATTIAQQHSVISWHIPQTLAFWLGITIAVYLAAFISGGKRAVKDLLSRIVRVKVQFKWYVIALFLAPVIAVVTMGIFKLFGGEIVVGKDIATASLPFVFLIELWLFLITEETAWRGFALPRLQSKYTPLKASIILGAIWALWHIPLFLIADSFQSSIPYIGFFISTIATTITMTWLFNNTRGSVFLAAIFHASTDVAIGYLGVMSGSRGLFWLFVALQVLVAVLIASNTRFKQPVRDNPELAFNIEA